MSDFRRQSVLRCAAINPTTYEQCANEARYIDDVGALVCGTCPIRDGADSIKIGDVPALLDWCRDVLAGGFMGGSSFEALRKIIGVVPKAVRWPVLEDKSDEAP